MVVLHTALLVGAVVEVVVAHRPFVPVLGWAMLVLLGLSQALRWWCITTLGPQWNTRILVVPDLPRVTGGPYRLFAHPDYVAVVVEGAALPLVHTAWITAVAFTVLNAVLLRVRISAENAALADLAGVGVAVRDVLVAGGGPVGLVAALHAARANLTVTVIEPRDSPIDKACGEGLMPGAVQALAELGVVPVGRAFRGICYRDGRRSAVADFAGRPGLGVRRTVLQSVLHHAAVAAGVEIVRGRVDSIEQDAGSVLAGGLRGRHLIAADGLHSSIRRLLHLEDDRRRWYERKPRPRWGMRVHYRLRPWSDRVEVHWSPGGEAYVTPVAEDCVGVAILGSVRAPFAERLTAFPALAQRLDGPPLARARAAGPLRQKCRARVAGRVLLVGDAGGYVDALTGEGLRLGFACAQAAVERIGSGRTEAYEADYRRISRSYRLLTSGLVQATSSDLVRANLVATAARAPWAFRGAVGLLAR